jgi:hypothetical protein
MSSQERQESKPWDAEGISRATWYRRRHRETAAETETKAETAGEIVDRSRPDQEAAKEVVEKVSGDGEPPETLPSEPQPALSATDLTRHAERFRAARKEKGEMIATRALRWELQDAGVLYDRLQREVDRVRQLAGY